MLLRSGYNTDYKYGRENWKPSDYHNFMVPWGKNEFKNEVSRMREKLEKIGIQYNGWYNPPSWKSAKYNKNEYNRRSLLREIF